MTTSTVVDLTPHDTGEAAAVKAAAFVDLDIAHWLVPDNAAERERCLREQFAFLIRAALGEAGRLQGIREEGRLIASALWTVRTGGPATEPAGYDAALRSITGTNYRRFRALDDVFAATTPAAPHHHLDLLAATRRGAGFGTRLLSSYLTELDQRPAGPPMAYLQASNADAARLYLRHGFEAGDPAEIPDSDGLYVIPMHRQSA